MFDIQAFFERYYLRLQAHPQYLRLMMLPTLQRWGAIAGLFIASQIVVFGSLYLLFGKIVVVGFLASILAGLATGVGALPALFFKDISPRLFNSMLGAAAGAVWAKAEEINTVDSTGFLGWMNPAAGPSGLPRR